MIFNVYLLEGKDCFYDYYIISNDRVCIYELLVEIFVDWKIRKSWKVINLKLVIRLILFIYMIEIVFLVKL